MTELATRAGLSLAVPPATVADAAALTACFDRVSGEDRRFRFFSASSNVSHEQLDPLIHADHFTSKSWLAFDKAGNELVASGLLACGKALDTGEIAVSVRGDYKGMGVGWALLDHIAREAEAGGRRVIAIESRDNHAAIAVERDKGFVPEPFEDDPTLVVLATTLR